LPAPCEGSTLAQVLQRLAHDLQAGLGFDPAALPGGTHGLAGMQARVLELRGHWRLRSAVGSGTCIQAGWPLPEPAAQARATPRGKTNGLDAEASNPLV
jgi:hypothetical protein